MKRIIGLLLCLCTIFSLCLALTSCFPERAVTYDEYGVGYDCYGDILSIKFDASGESAEVTIPDEHDGKLVTHISATDIGCKYIACCDDVVKEYRGIYDDVDETRVFALTLNIGKNINRVDTYCGGDFYKRTDDGRLIYYKVYFYWNCSENNEKYFSENGYLYDRIECNGYYVDGVHYEYKEPARGSYLHRENYQK